MLRRFIAGCGLLCAPIPSGCLQPPARACQVDDECSLASNGSCRAPGYCAYEASNCPSGLEFGPYAGQGLAGQCFVDGDGDDDDDDDDDDDTGATSGGQDSEGSDGVDPTTGDPQPSLELSELGVVAVPTSVGWFHVAASSERIAIAGHSDALEGFAIAVDSQDASPSWSALDPAGVGPHRIAAVAIDAQDVWLAGTRDPDGDGWGRPFASRLDPDGVPSWTQSWDTLGADAVFGASLDAQARTTIMGRLDARPWLVRLDPDGTPFQAQQWDLGPSDIEPFDLASTAGGLAAMCGPNDAEQFGLRLVDAAGAVVARSEMLFADPCTSMFAGPSTLVVAGLEPGSVGGFDYAGAAQWFSPTEAPTTAALIVDAAGHPIAAGVTSEGIVLERFASDGSASISTTLEGTFDRVAMALHAAGVVVASATTEQSEIALWRIEP